MNTTAKTTAKYFTVPAMVLVDILFILHSNKLHYEVKDVTLEDYSILLYVTDRKQPVHFDVAIENIDRILRDYAYYLNGTFGKPVGKDE